MPELPEVETIARGLARRVTGERIVTVWLGAKPEPLKSPAAAIAHALEGARIAAVRRAGKQLVFDLEGDRRPRRRQFIVHLGMTGRMLVASPQDPLAAHTHAIVTLHSGREMRFVDPRRFGRLSVVTGKTGFQAAGAEPLDIGLEQFAGLFRGRRTPIKSALLDQERLGGVGNIYADEALFRAGVRPRRRAASLTRAELRRLYEGLQQVLNEAIAAGGSSVSDYVGADGEEGFFQLEHRVYQRTGEPCLVCRTPIKRVVVAGRSTHYCPRCQE
jgi:formamidopyrimidine-DNA glycosylase